jgi:hypothetical protein
VRTPIAILLSLTFATDLCAQRVADAVAGYSQPSQPPATATATVPATTSVGRYREPSTGSMVVTGMLFAAGGIMAGATAGAQMERCEPGQYFCGMGGAILGGMIGEIVMLPIGVHTSSDHAPLGRKVKASALIMLAGLAAAPVTGGASILLTPPAQLWYLVRQEKNAARREQALATR